MQKYKFFYYFPTIYPKDNVFKMKIKINEIQLKKIVREMAYPSSFNFDEFKNIKSYKGKMEYCQRLLQRISSGSARVVYKIDDEKVLKLAKNQKGLAQNQTEYSLSSCCYRSPILAQTFDFDEDNGYWIEMELARKVKINDFERIVGYDISFIKYFIIEIANEYQGRKQKNYMHKEGFDKLMELFYNEDYNNFKNWEWFDSLASYLRDYQNPSGDILRASSWGIVKRNGEDELVIIDFGLNDDVFNSYYS